jgi:FKBP-type peptidyl-prolyl cis-trans isomerase FkpA/FKBP-type peptidyl-prolyl cis-trans isomerase FklB
MKAIVYRLSVLLFCTGCYATYVAAAEPSGEDQKTLYALGVAISQNLSAFALSESDLEMVKSGMSDGVLKRPLKVDMQTYGPKIQQFAQSRVALAAEKEKKSGADYLAKVAAEPGIQKTESGALVKITKEGSGAMPTAADTVKVHYQGTLIDGTVFDSSIKRNEPATFALSGVIKCWTEGLQKIKVGGKARLVCPSAIAYGDRGSPPVIKPGATLIFDVELLDIVK